MNSLMKTEEDIDEIIEKVGTEIHLLFEICCSKNWLSTSNEPPQAYLSFLESVLCRIES